MPSFSIQSTRAGFYYQDLYAVLSFLSAYEENHLEITGFFVDFGYDEEHDKSDDILMQFKQEDDTITASYYDIKTGDAFRANTKDVLAVIAEFIRRRKAGNISNIDTTHMVVSHDVGRALVNFKTHVDSLRLYKTMREEVVQKAVDYFKGNLPDDCYTDINDLHTSLQLIKFVPSAPPLIVIDGEPMSDIRQTICTKIESIANKLNIENLNYTAFPKDMLINDMLSLIQASDGSNQDLTTQFKVAMANYYARSKTNTPDISPGESGGLNQAISAVKKVMNDFESGGRGTPQVVPDQIVEGATTL